LNQPAPTDPPRPHHHPQSDHFGRPRRDHFGRPGRDHFGRPRRDHIARPLTVKGVITLEQMQARHRALRAQLESLTPEITGEVPARDRNRVRGLPAEWSDGERLPIRAAAPKRRADDIEPAPRRRVMAHEREDAFMDDVLAEEGEDAPPEAKRTLGRRASETRDFDYVADLEDARGPRHVRALRSAPTTVRRPGRERSLEFPDAVHPQCPSRSWDDQPEQGHHRSRGAKPLRRSPKC
jgi:hypothetical protein